MSGLSKNADYMRRQRKKIQAAQLVPKLIEFIDGEREMTAAQVQTALRLLNKVIPDVKQIEVTGKVDVNVTRQEVEARLIEHGIDPEQVWQRRLT